MIQAPALLLSSCMLFLSAPAGQPGALAAPHEGEKTGVRLFYRMLGASRNAPLLPPRTRSVCGRRGSARTAGTGMALTGFTEYPFCKGVQSYTFAEKYAYFPRIVSGAVVDPEATNCGDILIDHVYEPDPCVWGSSAREFTQTFVATGKELVSITLLVASEPGTFRAALLEGGPGGRIVGPVQSFRSGHSMEWGWARWKAGDAPLEPGRTYGIRLWKDDGKPWMPYLHATGDCYDGGLLYADGRPLEDTDLGAWIIEEPPDLSRAVVENTDREGWAYAARGVTFVPRTPNIRLVSLAVSPASEKCREIAARVWTTDDPPRLLAGPKHNLACIQPGGVWEAHLLFADDECRVTPGKRYRLEVFTVAHKAPIPPPEKTVAEPYDIQARLYGEPQPRALPAIHNLRGSVEKETDLHLRWSITLPAEVRVELERLHPGEEKVVVLPPGRNEITLPGLWRGHEHALRLLATGPTGIVWRTPTYRVMLPGGPQPKPLPPLYKDHPDVFLPLAPPPENRPANSAVLRYRAAVPLRNPGFEDGLEGWETSPAGVVRAAGRGYGISPAFGDGMAGWSHIAGEKREQVFERSHLRQKCPTTAGHEYLLSARALTAVENGPRGDTRVRLCADPRGETDFGGENGTQWYWTDGRWMRFEHRFIAEADEAAVALELFRWRDLDRASAYVDQVMLLDLGPARREPAEGGAAARGVPARVLAGSRMEAEDRAEAYIDAPAGYVITGLGARAAADNVTTIRLRIRPLLPGGTLGPQEWMLAGWEPDAGLEADIELPDGYVATGFGARIAPEWDVKTLALWGRPLSAKGLVGRDMEFRAGVEPRGGLEKAVRLPRGRVLTGAGLRCSLNDVAGIRARSAQLIDTETGAWKKTR